MSQDQTICASLNELLTKIRDKQTMDAQRFSNKNISRAEFYKSSTEDKIVLEKLSDLFNQQLAIDVLVSNLVIIAYIHL